MQQCFENHSESFQIPTKRMAVYERFNLSRNEGRILCGLLGFGTTAPLTQPQIESLSRLTNLYRKYQSKGIGLGTFIKNYTNNSN